MQQTRTAILHYTAPPVVAGVEMVMLAQAKAFQEAGYPVTLIAGKGNAKELPEGIEYIEIPELDANHPAIDQVSQELEKGTVPRDFDPLVKKLEARLGPILDQFDHVIVHNVLSKHFNLVLTAAIFHLFDSGKIHHLIDWVHDITWTSQHSGHKVHSGYPWNLLKTYDPHITYVTISTGRQEELAELFDCPPDKIHVVYNGVDPEQLLGLSEWVCNLAHQVGLLSDNINLLLPVRIAEIKNIELAIQVVSKLSQDDYPIRLVITGPLDVQDNSIVQYYHKLLKLRDQLRLQQQVRFVYEIEQDGKHVVLESDQVGGFFRLSDALLMPSHREGFGNPVLEAGLVGLPVFCTPIPSAIEIGREDIHLFAPDDEPEDVAQMIEQWIDQSTVLQLKRRVRSQFTWSSIFQRKILPLLMQGEG